MPFSHRLDSFIIYRYEQELTIPTERAAMQHWCMQYHTKSTLNYQICILASLGFGHASGLLKEIRCFVPYSLHWSQSNVAILNSVWKAHLSKLISGLLAWLPYLLVSHSGHRFRLRILVDNGPKKLCKKTSESLNKDLPYSIWFSA